MSKKLLRILSVVFMALFGILVIYIASLGFFNSVEVDQRTSKPLIMYGKAYEGQLRSEKFDSIFVEVGAMKENNQVEGYLAGMYFNDPKSGADTVKAIIGFMVADSSYTYPGFAYYPIKPRQVVQANIEADFKVASARLYGAVRSYAEDHEITLKSQYLEWYEGKDNAFLQVPVVNDSLSGTTPPQTNP